jgi:O-antigen/teichoic acid export membrane protein
MMGILNNIFFQQDTLLLKVLLGDYRAVGLFAAAYRLVTFFIFVTIPTLWPLLPEFAKLAGGAGEREALAAGARRAGRAVLLYVLPPTVLVAAFAPELVRIVFGGAYAPAAAALTVVAVSMTARPVGYMSDATLIAAGRQRYLAIVAAAAVLVNLALDLILIPRLGFMGAAWGTAVADVVGLIMSLVIASAVLRRFVFDAGAFAPVALAAAGGVALYLARRFTAVPAPVLFVAAAAAFGAGVYFLLGREARAALARALGRSGGSTDAGG